MLNKAFAKYEDDLVALAKTVWENPESGFRENVSSSAHITFLRKMGFEIEENVAGTMTGYVASWGSGKPVLAFLGEFDALYGLAQQADKTEVCPIPGQKMGQGCGHHLLGVGAIAGALLLRDFMKEQGLSGTIRIYGCPAEESGSGKAYMARDGLFADCDAALTWHPSNFHMISTGSTQSCIQCYFRFTGIPAHAAGAPHLGRSALDAVELMNVGVNYLREHMEDSDRVHYSITNPGGSSPNVVQAFAESRYLVRSVTNSKCKKLYERVIRIAQGAALMTDTKLEVVFDEGLSNTVPNFVLENVLDEAFRKAGVPEYTPEERAYAAQFKATVPVEHQLSDLPGAALDCEKLAENVRSSELCDYYIETKRSDVCEMGSTDVGDVSWVTPTCTVNLNCFAYGAGAHSWQWVAQGKSDIAMKGMLKAGEILALAGLRLLEQPELLWKARGELAKRLNGEQYECLIPDDVHPHYFD